MDLESESEFRDFRSGGGNIVSHRMLSGMDFCVVLNY